MTRGFCIPKPITLALVPGNARCGAEGSCKAAHTCTGSWGLWWEGAWNMVADMYS